MINDDATDCIAFVTLFTIELMLVVEDYFLVRGKLNNFNINC